MCMCACLYLSLSLSLSPWAVAIAATVPLMRSVRRIIRSFAIFPGIWEAFEDLFAGLGMKDEAREAVFHQNGGDQSNPEQDMYYMLSTTLLYEFVLETVCFRAKAWRCMLGSPRVFTDRVRVGRPRADAPNCDPIGQQQSAGRLGGLRHRIHRDLSVCCRRRPVSPPPTTAALHKLSHRLSRSNTVFNSCTN